MIPLIVLGIPIVGSEVLIYYLILAQGFVFNVDNLSIFTNIFYYIPIILAICLFLSWKCFNLLGVIAYHLKKHKNIFTYFILLFISLMSIYIYPVREWLLITLIVLSIVGYYLKRVDTFPILYGFFLTDLFWDNLMRVMVIYG